jgi:hypothetical protein
MLEQLLLSACDQLERSEPAVRAAALMHIARVMARPDQAATEQLLDQGIALAETIEGDAPSLLLQNAICLAAAVSAKHALPLYAKHRQRDPFDGPVVALVNVMAQHGHIRDPITYLHDPLPGDRFPLHFVGNLEQECHDDETRRELPLAFVPSTTTSALWAVSYYFLTYLGTAYPQVCSLDQLRRDPLAFQRFVPAFDFSVLRLDFSTLGVSEDLLVANFGLPDFLRR